METTLEKATAQLEGAVYHAAVKFFEALEHEGCVIGNGHHAAQNVANEAVEELRRRWNPEQENTTMNRHTQREKAEDST